MSKEELLILISFALIIPIVCLLIFGCAYLGATLECNRLSELNPHLEFQVDIYNLCMVRTPGGTWISASNLHLIEMQGGE